MVSVPPPLLTPPHRSGLSIVEPDRGANIGVGDDARHVDIHRLVVGAERVGERIPPERITESRPGMPSVESERKARGSMKKSSTPR